MMKFISYLLIITIFFSCSKTKEYNTKEYFEHVNSAELAICNENFKQALSEFEIAFEKIEKPFGKDVFNAALSSEFVKDYKKRDDFLQQIINNSDDLNFLKSVFVSRYISEQEWKILISKKELKYNTELRTEFNEIHTRDQLFRPMYETYDDTINSNRKLNLKRIIEMNNSVGFPSQLELGYSNYLRSQPHDIVLHHTAQRRSYDKSVIDLEPILNTAVEEGRFDPEAAILYISLQDDIEKSNFEVYSSWQYKHPLLPDSLNNKVWFPRLDKDQKLMANKIREKWYANSLEDIIIKIDYLNNSDLPFIFSSVKKSIANFKDDFDKETALQQYKGITSIMVEH